MSKTFRPVAVLGGSRTPFVKSFTSFRDLTNQDIMTAAVKGLVEKYKLQGEVLGDVALGSVMLNSKDWNLGREVVLGSGLDARTPGYNVQRACGTGLETANQVALKIAAGQIEVGIAGGSDTNSDLPIMGSRELAQWILNLRDAKSVGERLKLMTHVRPSFFKPVLPAVVEPRTGKSMGDHCELMVKEWKIGRAEQDLLALTSHQNAARAYGEGYYDSLITPLAGVSKDGIVRGDTTLEKMAKLKPAFDRSPTGTLTAANSTPLTDGASAVLFSSMEWAQKKNIEVLARFVDCEVAGVDFVGGAGLLMAPTIAVSRLLERNQLTLEDFDFYEIHEAFAGQVLCTLKAWEDKNYCQKVLGRSEILGKLDRSRMNIKGGSVALGHPFAATGGRIVANLAQLLKQKGLGRGLISICTGGGMGIAAILER